MLNLESLVDIGEELYNAAFHVEYLHIYVTLHMSVF
jgi:hypothetical protein